MGFVCLCVGTSYVCHGVCLVVRWYKLCLAWGLSGCALVQVMFGVGFVCVLVQVMFGMGFVWLCGGTSYVWHGVCLVVRWYKLCLAWCLSGCALVQVMFGMGFVCSKHSSLIVFGIFGSPEKDSLLVLKMTVIVSPEKDWLLQQDLYSAILPRHCSLIVEVFLQVIPLSLGFSSRVLSWPPPAAPPINPQSPGTSSSSSSPGY